MLVRLDGFFQDLFSHILLAASPFFPRCFKLTKGNRIVPEAISKDFKRFGKKIRNHQRAIKKIEKTREKEFETFTKSQRGPKDKVMKFSSHRYTQCYIYVSVSPVIPKT
jgi:hypothetical protein